MRNISNGLAAAAALAWALPAGAQQQAAGFAAERLYLSAPGGTWFVLDDLSSHGALLGAVSLTLGYAHRPLVVQPPGSATRLAVVRHQTFADVGLALGLDRFRLYAHLSSPLYVAGQGGRAGDFLFTAPATNVEQNPDTIADAQLGFDARLFGEPAGPLRLGVDAVLIFPSGDRAGYLTDDTYRMTARALFAGDAGAATYAAHLGVHFRPLDESPVPDSPRGSELLFGAAAGARLPLGKGSLVVGPEVYGTSAFQSLFGSATTALEALLTGRFEEKETADARLGIKFGIGVGVHPRFGTPEWRAVVGIDLRGEAAAAGSSSR